MRPDCRKRISDVVGEPITGEFERALDRRMRRSVRALRRSEADWNSLGREDRLYRAGQHAAETFARDMEGFRSPDAAPGARQTLDELLADPDVMDFERRMNTVPVTVGDDMTQDALATAGRSYSVDGQRVEFGGAIDHLRKTAEAYAGGPVKAERQVTIVIGPPAAGKSTIAEAYARAARAAIVDPDDAKLVIPEYDGGVGGNAVHKESKLLAGEVLAGMIDDGANLVLPRIGSKQKELEILVRGFKSEGYEIAIVRVDVAPDEAARRMISRFRQTNRLVPTEYFRTIGDGPKRALAGLNKEGIRYAEIDFNGPKGVADIIDGDPKLAAILRKQGFRSGQGHRAGDRGNVRGRQAAPGSAGRAQSLNQGGDTPRGTFDTKDNLIRLTDARDVATFMHEGAHWYLDVLDRLAEGGNSHPFVREQLDAVYQWHGVKKGFRAYDAAGNVTPEGRELHEAFAETFEAYLRNGEAPSAALKGVFEQFREWLAQIYASLTGLERARLTPEIKAVFDRMLATDPELKGLPRNADPAAGGIQANGYLFREADGWTPEAVRGKAAKANIQKGSGDVTDTALAFREFPDMVDNSLPVSSQHISQARALASLDPDVFGMVRNGILKPEHAAVIGRYVPEQSRHKAVAQAVIEAGPTNADQARFVVRAAIEAGFRGDVQETLFGLQQFQTSMLKDKMKLTGDTLAKLRSDKRVFSLLEAEADRIQAAGNTLDRSANASKAEASAVVEDIVLRLATRKGPISDMFNAELAAMADGTTTRAAAAGRLADALRTRFDEDGISAFTEAPRPVREILPDPDRLTGDDVPTPEDVDALAAMADTDTGDMFNTVPGDDGAVRKPGDALRALDRQIASLTACAYPGATT